MTSKVEICNIALSNIRAGSINSIDEASVEAQQCKLKYDLLLDQMLRDAPFQFAHKNQALAVLSDDLFNWAYAYQYPSGCLKINRLMLNYETVTNDTSGISAFNLSLPDLKKQINYEILNVDGNKVIGANESELRIDYRSRVSDTNLFDAQFIFAFAHLLSSELAVPLVGGKLGREMRSDELQIYQVYIDAAITADLNEQYHEPVDSEYVTTRN